MSSGGGGGGPGSGGLGGPGGPGGSGSNNNQFNPMPYDRPVNSDGIHRCGCPWTGGSLDPSAYDYHL